MPHHQKPFVYGACRAETSRPGTAIDPTKRSIDFFYDEPYASTTQRLFAQLGLPLPQRADIFRGRLHDLLFLDSHGVVIRVGPLDMNDMLNPGMLQPLGWVSADDTPTRLSNWTQRAAPLTVAVYPGIAGVPWDWEGKDWACDSVRSLLRQTGQSTRDTQLQNIGVIFVRDDQNQTCAVPLMLDADSFTTGASSFAHRRARERVTIETHKNIPYGVDMLANDIRMSALSSAFTLAGARMAPWVRAHEAHEPLRRLFSLACDPRTGNTDLSALARFWRTCAEITQRPRAMTAPAWRSYRRADGVRIFERRDLHIAHVALSRPWTGSCEDQIPVSIPGTSGYTRATFDR